MIMKRSRPGRDDWIRNTQRRLRNWVRKFLDSLRGRQLTWIMPLYMPIRPVRGTFIGDGGTHNGDTFGWFRYMRYRIRARIPQ